MKKALKVLIIAVVLLMTLPVTNAFAYEGGLLHGKAMTLGNAINNGTETTTNATDGDSSTSVTVMKYSSAADSSNDTLWYEFEQPMDITDYQLISSSNTTHIIFYNAANSVIADIKPIENTGNKVTYSVQGVKTVAVRNNTSLTNISVPEFDVFGRVANNFLNGLLDSVPYTVSADSLSGYPIAFDNLAASQFVYIGAAAGGGIRIKFQKPINMTEYYLKAQTGVTGLMHLYDSSGALIQTQTLPVGSPYSAYVPLVVDGISEIELTRVGAGRYGLIEFDAFGTSGVPITHSPVTNLQENHTFDTANLTWTNPSQEEFIGTIIKKDGVEVANLASNINSYSIKGLTAKTNYNFEVIARYSDSINSTSKSISILTDEVPPPEPIGEIIDLTVTAKPERVNLSWELPESDELKHVNIYREILKETSLLDKISGTRVAYAAETKIFETNGTYFNDLTVKPDTTYEYTLTTTSTEGAESEGVTTEVATPKLEIVGGGYKKDPATGDFIYYWDKPTEGQVKVLIDGTEYITVDAAEQQVTIPAADMKYSALRDPLISVIPIGTNGTIGEEEKAETLLGTAKLPFSVKDLFTTSSAILYIIGGILLFALAFIFSGKFMPLLRKSIGKRTRQGSNEGGSDRRFRDGQGAKERSVRKGREDAAIPIVTAPTYAVVKDAAEKGNKREPRIPRAPKPPRMSTRERRESKRPSRETREPRRGRGAE